MPIIYLVLCLVIYTNYPISFSHPFEVNRIIISILQMGKQTWRLYNLFQVSQLVSSRAEILSSL